MNRERFQTYFRIGATFTMIAGLKWMIDQQQNGPVPAVNANNQGQPTFLSPIETVVAKENTSNGKIASAFTKSVQYWKKSLQRWGGIGELDPDLLATVMQIESCGDPDAISSSGARGLFQVMPFNFPKEIQQNPEQMLNSETNARVATDMLKGFLDKTNGNVKLALAAYNGGNIVLKYPSNPERWSDQTQRYYRWAQIYEEVKQNPQQSPTLQAWLETGGASLCRQAEERLGINQK